MTVSGIGLNGATLFPCLIPPDLHKSVAKTNQYCNTVSQPLSPWKPGQGEEDMFKAHPCCVQKRTQRQS